MSLVRSAAVAAMVAGAFKAGADCIDPCVSENGDNDAAVTVVQPMIVPSPTGAVPAIGFGGKY